MARTLGPYKIHSELGRGAMAVVWRAHDSVLERDVAIKEPLLPQGLDALAQTEFGARFVREAKAAARLNHPNIVTIHAADIYDGHPAIVMELIEGQTLGQMLERGPLDKALAIHVLEQLLSAVGYAHERGIVHRDIKPDNIFVTPDGRVKLADFGIASLASDSTLTQAGTIMGTPGYMAPEQITGAPVDGRADLFSCGVLAYEMLTGQNPFGATEGLPTTTVMYRIVHQAPPELPAEALAELPANLSSVLGAALAKDPADRFSDAASFLAALGGQGALPVPGLGTAVGAAQGMGTMMARLSRVKSATMISRGPGKPQEATWTKSWLPYAAVVGIGLIIMIALLASAGGGGGSSAATVTTVWDLAVYSELESELVQQLESYSNRFAEIVKVINANLPYVPSWVSDELMTMQDTLDDYRDQFEAMSIPGDYLPAYLKLDDATVNMIYRADVTNQAVQITRNSGNSGDAWQYWDLGRSAGNSFVAALAEYYSLARQR